MDHKDLEVWKQAVETVIEIYKLTDTFPNTEIYGLTNQLRRAAVSVPSNIAEGAARKSDKEFIHFLHIALGSISEIETQIIIAEKLDYTESVDVVLENVQIIRKMISGLVKYLRNK